MTENLQLPQRVQKIKLDDKTVYIVGTAHVSKQSVEDAKITIETVKPDAVCIELCEGRYKNIVEKDAWQKTDIFKVIKEKKSTFVLVGLVMSAFYKKLGEKLDVEPGAEMIQAAESASQVGAELVLADRDIKVTLKRVWGYLSLWDKVKLISNVAAGLFVKEEINEEMIEQIKQQDQLEVVMAEFAEKFPEIKKRLLDERDIYLAQKIRVVQADSVVAVVGAGHVEGIKKHIIHTQTLGPLMKIPPVSFISKAIKWLIPTAIIALIVWGFFKGGAEHTGVSILIWILVNGCLSALGAAIALPNPITVIAAFFASPITSLNPFMAAGWVAGLVQAFIKKPKVSDFQTLPDDIATVKGFWANPVTKILLVTVLANLGSSAGGIIAGIWIALRSI